MNSLTLKKPGLSSMSSTMTWASRSGCGACSSSLGSVISVTSSLIQVLSSSSSSRRSLGGADVLALDQLQVVRQPRQQEDVQRPRALMRLLALASLVSYSAGFAWNWRRRSRRSRGSCRRTAGRSPGWRIRIRGFRNQHFGGDFHLVAYAQVVQVNGQVFHQAAGLRARTCTHQPLPMKLRTILAAKAKAALAHR